MKTIQTISLTDGQRSAVGKIFLRRGIISLTSKKNRYLCIRNGGAHALGGNHDRQPQDGSCRSRVLLRRFLPLALSLGSPLRPSSG